MISKDLTLLEMKIVIGGMMLTSPFAIGITIWILVRYFGAVGLLGIACFAAYFPI